MKVLDLFSGIGGFSLGLERAGMHTVAFCERDEFCRAVLAKHWPGVPCFDDIHTLDAERLDRLGRIDLVCGGFPCQPFSQAGKQRAQADDRHLWPAMCEVIALARPTWVLGENVAGIIALALDDVLADLEGLGYAARPLTIPACAVDAHHRRNRVWIIARDTHGQSESVGPIDAEMAQLPGALADSTRELLDGRGNTRATGWPEPSDGRTPSPNAPSMQRAAFIGNESNGADDSARCAWEPESGVGRVADGIPRRVDRLRTLGNAVVPQVVYELGRAIMSSAVNSSPSETQDLKP